MQFERMADGRDAMESLLMEVKRAEEERGEGERERKKREIIRGEEITTGRRGQYRM